jgi:hypothetical protein
MAIHELFQPGANPVDVFDRRAGDSVLSVARGILEMMEPMSARCAIMRASGSATNRRYRIVTQSIPANE